MGFVGDIRVTLCQLCPLIEMHLIADREKAFNLTLDGLIAVDRRPIPTERCFAPGLLEIQDTIPPSRNEPQARHLAKPSEGTRVLQII